MLSHLIGPYIFLAGNLTGPYILLPIPRGLLKRAVFGGFPNPMCMSKFVLPPHNYVCYIIYNGSTFKVKVCVS